MPVSTTTSATIYTGNGATLLFATTFRILNASHLKVYLDDVQQVGGYTVANVGAAGGSNITFTIAPTSGVTVRLQRETPLTRSTDYVTNGDLAASTLDDDQDQQTMQVQDAANNASRALKVPANETPADVPAAATRAGKFLYFTAAGDPAVADTIAINAAQLAGVGSIALLRALSVVGVADGSTIEVTSYYGDDAGGGGKFVWRTANVVTDNGGTVIKPTAVSGAGRWLRVYSGAVNVAWFGAILGQSASTITAAILAAINVLDNGTEIIGEVEFPSSRYATNADIIVGDGSKYVALKLTGVEYSGASNSPLELVQLEPSGAATNGIVFKAPTSKSHSLVIEGINILMPGGSTGTGLDLTGGAQVASCIYKGGTIMGGAVGVKIGSSVGVKLQDGAVIGCGKGIQFVHHASDDPNLPQFDNFTVQACTTSGISVETLVSGLDADSLVIQSNTGPGIDILVSATARGILSDATFKGGWFEFPGTDMIRLSGAGGANGPQASDITFLGTRFDGSSGVGGRNVFNITSTVAGTVAENITLIGGQLVNLNGGKLTNIVTDPTGSSDPGYRNLSVIDVKGAADIKGVHTYNSDPNQMLFIKSRDLTRDNILVSGIYSNQKPRYALVRGGLETNGLRVGLPSANQLLSVVGDTVPVVAEVIQLANISGGSLTMTSAPTIADGTSGQKVRLINMGSQNIVLQDQGTLANSNLRLTAATVTLAPRNSVELTFMGAITDWVQTGPVVAVL